MSRVKFTIDVDMEEKWVDDFCSFLRYLQFCGDARHSSIVGFYADGDKGFRANFNIGMNFNIKDGEMNSLRNTFVKESQYLIQTSRGNTLPYISAFNVERVFDAG